MEEQPRGILIGNRYQIISRIGVGGMGIVYRARDRLTGNIVALKMVTVSGSRLEFASKFESGDYNVALAQEFRTLATVRHPYVISVLDYGFHVDSKAPQVRLPFFTMEFLDNAQAITKAAGGLLLEEKLRLIFQMVQAVAYLHRRGIIHRDLKPDNVVVIPSASDELEVRVLDFGLAVAREEGSIAHAGTLAYMAPEVLQGKPATELSDLWAIGIMAYEIIAGHHPYNVSDVSDLINSIIFESPDLLKLKVDDSICALLEKMVASDTIYRARNAQTIVQDFEKIGIAVAPRETETIRESFLQAARFVGREHELTLLRTALQRIVQSEVEVSGQTIMDEDGEYTGEPVGSIWLVGGESGVGKTRLLEELRSHALVEGALVLRGYATSDSGVPYQIWHNVLRQLCLQVPLSPLEISTLKKIVPDIDTHLDVQAVPAMQTTEFLANQTLLLRTIELLFRRQQRPVVVILDNLHWAEDDSINLLKFLTRIISSMRLMILASYRSDEKPELQDRLPTAELIELDRLPRETIAALSESMLGEAGRDERVVSMLERETEGNILFIVEAVRALAEESGELSEIGRKTLPQKIFAQGMQSVIHRRLEAVPAEARPLLYAAAAMGRELDLNFLQTVESPMDFDDWLFIGEMAVILEVREGRWQFVHDKLREGLLAELSPEAHRDLHRQVAEKLEVIYPNDAEQQVRLARLWREAGEYARELPYNMTAARRLAGKEDYVRSMELYERAMELVTGSGGRPEDLIWVYEGIGNLYTRTGRFAQATPFLMEALKVAEAERLLAHKADVLRSLGEMKRRSGAPLEQALALWQQALEIRKKQGNVLELAKARNDLGKLLTLMKNYDLAESEFEAGIQLAEQANEIELVAANTIDLGMLEFDRGHYAEAQAYLEKGLGQFTLLGRNTAVARTLLNLARVALGMNNYPAAASYIHNALELAQSLENIHFMITALDFQAQVFARTGQHAQAVEYLTFTVRYDDYSEMDSDLRAELLKSLKLKVDEDTYTEAVHKGAEYQLDDIVHNLLMIQP